MKKQIFALVAVGVAACCLGACKKNNNNEKYDELNAMLHADYSQIVITVTDTFDEDTVLESEYRISYSADTILVEYSVEQFSEISLDNPTQSVITRLVGEATIKGEEITFDGDTVPMTAGIAHPSFVFNVNYFKNADLAGNYLIADVKNPSAFMGTELTCSDMKVRVTFLEVLLKLDISYISASGSQVKYSYAFTH